MSKALPHVALCSALAIGDADGQAPDWIHLIPAGEVRTNDGRGPYRVADTAALLASSMHVGGGRLVLDENHATDLAVPRGGEAPARGWIVELQSRDDGVWGRVEWTDTGRRMVEGREYRGISPVVGHRADGTITHILRASLVNQPNLRGLTALHQEQTMDFRAWLIEALGLDSGAEDVAIQAAVTEKVRGGGADATAVALQAALGPIARAVGLAEKSDAAAVLAGVEAMRTGDDDRVTALQSELAGVTVQLNALRDESAKEKATTFVDGAITLGRVGIKAQRDRYISMHMKDPAGTAELINAMPVLKPGAALTTAPGGQAESCGDDAVAIARHATAYQRKLADEGQTIDFATAVMAVQEGRHK